MDDPVNPVPPVSPNPSASPVPPASPEAALPPGSSAAPLPAGLPALPNNEERMLAMLAHLITFMSSFIGPLVIYLVKKDESAFVADHAKEVLNFHLSVLIYAIIAFISLFLLIGIVLLPALGVFVLVVTIIGAIRAYEGQLYRYPLCIRFIN